VSQL
jgi:hypothetical protein